MKKALIFGICCCLGCSRHSAEPDIRLSLTGSNRSLKITGFNKAIIDDIGRDSSAEAWETLLPVYKMPADTEMKDFQNGQPGSYKVTGNEVIFTPDTPFKKGQVYFLRTSNYSSVKDAWQFLREKRQKGRMAYKDLIFSY